MIAHMRQKTPFFYVATVFPKHFENSKSLLRVKTRDVITISSVLFLEGYTQLYWIFHWLRTEMSLGDM